MKCYEDNERSLNKDCHHAVNSYKMFHNARNNKDDEYYTRYCDVEKKLSNYDFNGYRVLCPCNDVGSAFDKYFSQYGKCDEVRCLSGVDVFKDEAVPWFDWCDIVITNPPFSKFKQFVELLYKMDKKFFIIGSNIAFHTSGIWERFLNGTFNHTGEPMFTRFVIKHDYGGASVRVEPDGTKTKRVAINWWTNMNFDVEYKPRPMEHSISEGYKFYDEPHDDVLFISEWSMLPRDYYGKMAVPLSTVHKIDRNVFNILGRAGSSYRLDGRCMFERIIIELKDKNL